MATHEDLQQWVIDALTAQGGSASIVEVARHIWSKHETDLRGSGDLFYTWQYDMRWACTNLRQAGKVRPASVSRRGEWQLQ